MEKKETIRKRQGKRKKPVDEEKNLESMARMGILVKQLGRPTVCLSHARLCFGGGSFSIDDWLYGVFGLGLLVK